MRVRGLRDMNIEAIEKLNNNIDYALIEDECKDSPKEALRIAELLGVDEELISRSREKL